MWWRCHRRLISDVDVLECALPVWHLMPDGRLVEHVVSAGARVGEDGLVVWDGADTRAGEATDEGSGT